MCMLTFHVVTHLMKILDLLTQMDMLLFEAVCMVETGGSVLGIFNCTNL